MSSFLAHGHFRIGANYWASHAGPVMWRQWDAGIVERDLAQLADEGLQILRVFPLWSDFQPITQLRGFDGRAVEFRQGENPLPDEQIHQDGMSAEMLDRFKVLADVASKKGLDLVVGLITGWMSGRLFVPPALEGLNPLTDPGSILWQVRFVKTFVAQLANHPAIKAWDLGNECNCMGPATREQAWLWAATLTNAIRSADPSRPVISGMHGLGADPQSNWSIRDQGEITDILTTHPYPLFTPHCHHEALSSFRPLLHATAETCLYADLSGKPAFVEEFGNLGPMICGEEETARFLPASLASLWAHDARAALWWCGFDQLSLEAAPHDWIALERELGLVREDRSPKPVMRAMQSFRRGLEEISGGNLPPRRIDAVCIVTPGQDQWGIAFSAFLLAKQAGFDLRFHYADRALPKASLYLLPSLQGSTCLSRRRERELWDLVEKGAEVYLSLGDGLIGEFSRATGLEVVTRSERQGPCVFDLPDGRQSVAVPAPIQYAFRVHSAKVLATEQGGQPVFTRSRLGRGHVYCLTVPLEQALAREPQAFSGAHPYWRIYRTVAENILGSRVVQKSHPSLGITEHRSDDGAILAVMINHSGDKVEDTLALSAGAALAKVERGDPPLPADPNRFSVSLPPYGYAVWRLKVKMPPSDP